MTAATGEAAGEGNVAALERSDNVADRSHAFAVLKRGYTRRFLIGRSACLHAPKERQQAGSLRQRDQTRRPRLIKARS